MDITTLAAAISQANKYAHSLLEGVETGGAPYIGDNGNWFVWDSEDLEYKDSGIKAEGQDGEVTAAQLATALAAYRTSAAQDVIDAGKQDKPTSETYTIASASWSALASSAPFDYSATVTATHTIGSDTVCELVNDNAVLFATHGFAIGAVSGQSVTIYSIGQPSASVTLGVEYYG